MADEKQTVKFPDEQDVIVDRSRITHKASKRLPILGIELQRATRDLDAERAALLLEEIDLFVRKLVVSVPSSWLPDGVTLAQDDWLDHLTEDHAERVSAVARGETPGEKKA